MKKLLCSAAVCGLALAATPANAQLALELGGWMKGYGVYVDQDDDSGVAGESRDIDIIRHTEIHMGAESTLDNGLTVGFHLEAETDGDAPAGDAADSFDVEESYAYFSGGWGRVNFGAEDGAAYLLQVEAPSADDNIDGLRQFVQPVNYTLAGSGALAAYVTAGGIDYDQDQSGYADKLTYLSPIMNGFQVGVSYTPDVADSADDLDGVGVDDVTDTLGEAWEVGGRYEGQFNNVGIIAGAGYTHVDEEDDTTPGAGALEDDQAAWNAGLDLDIGPFGVGVAYHEDDFGEPPAGPSDDETTWVVGADYTTGPFKLGASYLNQDNTGDILGADGSDGIETERYSGGVVYTYGPGMTFRGSVSYITHDNVAGLTTDDEIDATSVVLGTQINF